MNFNLVYQNQTYDGKKKKYKPEQQRRQAIQQKGKHARYQLYYHIPVLVMKPGKAIGSNVIGVALSVGLILQNNILSDNTHLVFQITLTKLHGFQSYLQFLIKLKIERSMESMIHQIKGMSP